MGCLYSFLARMHLLLGHWQGFDACLCFRQVLVDHLMTPQDVKADALVTSAMQSSLTMLEAGSSEQCEASVELLQHLIPLHKHLTLLQRWLEVRASCSSV